MKKIEISNKERRDILLEIANNTNALELSTCFENDGTYETLKFKIFELEAFTGEYEYKLKKSIDKHITENFEFYYKGIKVNPYDDKQFREYAEERFTIICKRFLKRCKKYMIEKHIIDIGEYSKEVVSTWNF